MGEEDAPIVGGREDGDTAATMGHLVALGLDLVAADDVVQLVLLQEGLGDVRPELAAHAALADRAPVLGAEDGRLGTAGPAPPAPPRSPRPPKTPGSPVAGDLTTTGHTWGLGGVGKRRASRDLSPSVHQTGAHPTAGLGAGGGNGVWRGHPRGRAPGTLISSELARFPS